MLKTRGADWLKTTMESGSNWCKLVVDESQIQLDQNGGYALAGHFVSADAEIMLGPDEFLFVAAQKPGGTAGHKAYDYALITVVVADGRAQLSRISDTVLYAALYKAMTVPGIAHLVPLQRRRGMFSNYSYLAAVYCLLTIRGLLPKPAVAVATSAATVKPLLRRIDRGILKPKPVPAPEPLTPAPVTDRHGIEQKPPPRAVKRRR